MGENRHLYLRPIGLAADILLAQHRATNHRLDSWPHDCDGCERGRTGQRVDVAGRALDRTLYHPTSLATRRSDEAAGPELKNCSPSPRWGHRRHYGLPWSTGLQQLAEGHGPIPSTGGLALSVRAFPL
jgi:hypothetical protein